MCKQNIVLITLLKVLTLFPAPRMNFKTSYLCFEAVFLIPVHYVLYQNQRLPCIHPVGTWDAVLLESLTPVLASFGWMALCSSGALSSDEGNHTSKSFEYPAHANWNY